MLKTKSLPILAGAALLAAGLLAAVPSAHATVINLDQDHCTGGCGTMPAGDVTLLQNGTSVDVTVHLFDSNLFILSGTGDMNYFKFDATGVAAADVTIDQPFTAGVRVLSLNGPGSFDGDGTGNFDFGITCSSGTGCGNGSGKGFSNDIVFHVASAVISDLIISNTKGNVFVADIAAPCGGTTGLTCNDGSLSGFNTGPVAAAPAPSIGHGLSALVAVGGLLLGARLLRRKRPMLGTAIPRAA